MSAVDPITALNQIKTIAQQGIDYTPPAPPPPPLDVFSWWIPTAGHAVKPVFVRRLPDGRLAAYFMKTSQGWPMDIQLADGDGVYFRVTENDAKNAQGQGVGWPPNGSPAALRQYIGTNPSGTLGFKISPRYYDPSKGRVLVSDVSDVPTLRFSDCSTSVPGHLGPAQSWISMQTVAFGGVLGTLPSLVCEYYYTLANGLPNKFATRERFYLTEQSGWVVWDLSSQQSDGSYKVIQASEHNTFIADNTLVPVFPCGIAL